MCASFLLVDTLDYRHFPKKKKIPKKNKFFFFSIKTICQINSIQIWLQYIWKNNIYSYMDTIGIESPCRLLVWIVLVSVLISRIFLQAFVTVSTVGAVINWCLGRLFLTFFVSMVIFLSTFPFNVVARLAFGTAYIENNFNNSSRWSVDTFWLGNLY